MSYLIHLSQFEGPLGLLLYLIRKEEMDIFDIPIGEITQQYLEYIRMMKELDLEVAGEFVAMAATLIHIKSRMLLPQYNDEGEVVDQEDPRKELVQKLLEYQRYQDGAKQLYERPLLGRDVFARGVRSSFQDDSVGGGEIIVENDGLFSLISAYRRAMRKAQRLVHQVRPRVMSIATRVMELKDHLLVGVRVRMSDLVGIGIGPLRAQLLITFLSALELGRMGYVTLYQNDVYGDIYIEPKKPIEGNVLERVQEFENLDFETVARTLIDEASERQMDEETSPSSLKVDTETSSGTESFDPSYPLVESEQMALVRLRPIDGSAAESDVTEQFDADSLRNGESRQAEIATDEEILAAEAEIASAEDHKLAASLSLSGGPSGPKSDFDLGESGS